MRQKRLIFPCISKTNSRASRVALTLVVGCVFLSSGALAHTDKRGHAPGHDAVVSLARWQEHLEDFSSYGHARSLAEAERSAKFFMQSDRHKTPAVRYLVARTAQAAHRFEEAAVVLQDLLVRTPNYDSAHLLLASVFAVQGMHDRAVASCRKLSSVPLPVEIACTASVREPARLEDRNVIKAFSDQGLLEKLSGPTHAWVLGTSGDIAFKNGDLGGAVANYRAALHVAPSIRIRTSLVDALLKLGRATEALAIAKDARAPALQVKHLIALKQLNRIGESASLVDELRHSFQHDIAARDFTHGREIAEFYFEIMNDPRTAKFVLDASLVHQKEHEDLALEEKLANLLAAQGM